MKGRFLFLSSRSSQKDKEEEAKDWEGLWVKIKQKEWSAKKKKNWKDDWTMREPKRKCKKKE